ncbi:thermonuclease family protein [bacterium]|nr:thermonuclease family protein [bacterium]
MRLNQKIIQFTILFLLISGFSACKKLDKDGGYYDEKTKTYKYVNIAKKGVKKSSLQVFSPTPGKPQNIQGVVTRIEDDAKSIWLRIEDRHPYMIIAERLSGGNRNDKDKEVKVQLKFVSPLGSVSRNKGFRKKWQEYTIDRLKEQMFNRTVLIEIDYEENARKLWGIAFVVIDTEQGDRIRNINLWMIQQGLSYYFIDRGLAPEDQKYRDGQMIAQRYKSGIWKYQ